MIHFSHTFPTFHLISHTDLSVGVLTCLQTPLIAPRKLISTVPKHFPPPLPPSVPHRTDQFLIPSKNIFWLRYMQLSASISMKIKQKWADTKIRYLIFIYYKNEWTIRLKTNLENTRVRSYTIQKSTNKCITSTSCVDRFNFNTSNPASKFLHRNLSPQLLGHVWIDSLIKHLS